MEYKNDTLEKMKKKRIDVNIPFSKYYFRYFKDQGGVIKYDEYNKIEIPSGDCEQTLFNKGERLKSCLDFWQWDMYEKNRILDLQKVNRCKNTRFCPNCKALDISKFIHKFKDIFNEYIGKGYKFYMLTLTVPNCELSGEALEDHIKRLSKSFAKFFVKFGYEDKNALDGRYTSLYGGIRVLEITCDRKKGYHPHYHIVVMLKDAPDPLYMEQTIEGKFSKKSKKVKKLSLIELQFTKIWGMIWYKRKLTKRNIENYVVNPKEVFVEYYGEKVDDKVLQVDFRELDEKGLKEVFKYTFKSADVKNYEIFKGLEYALQYKRLRQGFGKLYNVKVDVGELEDGEEQALELAIPEDPQQLVTREIDELITTYREYKKISRFQPKIVEDIED